jgi:hypothetical protein
MLAIMSAPTSKPLASAYHLGAFLKNTRARGGVVVEVLRYKPEGHGFDSQWCHWIFSLT